MGVLAVGGVLASLATAWMETAPGSGTALAVVGFVLIGIGVGACGTSLLVLLAKRVDEGRRAAAATTVWLMMIVGFVVTAGLAGHFLDPFSPERLVVVTAVVAIIAFLVTLAAVYGVEGPAERRPAPSAAGPAEPEKPSFREALTQVWASGRPGALPSSYSSPCSPTAPRT
jgi:MFS transporter, BCD family, chlorophyll transporter